MKTLISVLMLSALAGCASTTPTIEYKTQDVYLPVAVCPAPPKVIPYVYETSSLPDNASAGDVAKAVRIDLVATKQRETMLLDILKKYEDIANNSKQ